MKYPLNLKKPRMPDDVGHDTRIHTNYTDLHEFWILSLNRNSWYFV